MKTYRAFFMMLLPLTGALGCGSNDVPHSDPKGMGSPRPSSGGGTSAGAGGDSYSPSSDVIDESTPSDTDQDVDPRCVRNSTGPSTMPRLKVREYGQELPYCTTIPFDSNNTEVTRAVIVVHGTGRNVDKYFSVMAQAQSQSEPTIAAQTVVVAPYLQAKGKDCIKKDKDGNDHDTSDHPADHDLVWSCDSSRSWKEGKDALDEDTSSFDALDALVRDLRKGFPALTSVTFTGFSAGGQLVQRYAAASDRASGANSESGDQGVTLRFAVGDPSSYLYFDGARLNQGIACTIPDPKYCDLTAESFVSPYFGEDRCPDYNNYRFGLAGTLPRYFDGMSADSIRDRYVGRDIYYIIGAKDNGPTSQADYDFLDTDCGADAQGPIEKGTDPKGKTVYHSYRAQRALTYWHYVNKVHGAKHDIKWIIECGHDQKCMYLNEEIRRLLFN